MKRKMVFVAAVALLLSVAGFATWAALNASATARNVITMGTVSISLRDEIQKSGSEDEWEAFPENVDILPGSTVDKRVWVKNVGENDCYVRVKLLMDIIPREGQEDKINPDDVTIEIADGQDWTEDGDGYVRFNQILQPGEEVPLYCAVLFDAKGMSNEYLGAKFKAKNLAEAVQAQNNVYDPASGTVLDVKGWPATINNDPQT